MPSCCRCREAGLINDQSSSSLLSPSYPHFRNILTFTTIPLKQHQLGSPCSHTCFIFDVSTGLRNSLILAMLPCLQPIHSPFGKNESDAGFTRLFASTGIEHILRSFHYTETDLIHFLLSLSFGPTGRVLLARLTALFGISTRDARLYDRHPLASSDSTQSVDLLAWLRLS